MQIDAIIQARIGSSRLRGKVLKKINGFSVLKFLLNQLDYSKLLNRIIIATTTSNEDLALVEFAKENQMTYFQGSTLDVLDRYYQCAKHYSIEHIARITSDNPLIDPEIVDEVIKLYMKGEFDYVNNFFKPTFPVGTEVEVFSFEALEKAWNNAKKPSEREHVTPYIYNNPEQFSIAHKEYEQDLSNLHWTVNTQEDLELVREIYNGIQNRPILLKNILKLLKTNPKLQKINSEINPHEGNLKSLKEDKGF